METVDMHEGENGVTFYSLKIDGQEVGRMLTTINPGVLVAGHTGIGLLSRRKGYGRRLMDAVVAYARDNGLKVIPDCGFVAMIFNKYPDLYEDVRGRR